MEEDIELGEEFYTVREVDSIVGNLEDNMLLELQHHDAEIAALEERITGLEQVLQPNTTSLWPAILATWNWAVEAEEAILANRSDEDFYIDGPK